MRIKLFLLLAVITATAALAQNTGLRGVVVNAQSGAPVAGATIMLDNQGVTVTTGPSGDFTMSNAQPGRDLLVVLGYGYKDWSMSVEIVQGAMSDVTLHLVQNVLVERFQRFREFPRCLSVEGVYAVGKHEVHIVEGHRLPVAVCVLARRSCALRNN